MRGTTPKPQQGAIALIAALWLGVALSCLMVLDIGHLFWQQRELQKIADLAALAGAAEPQAGCHSNATANAASNGMRASDEFTPESGKWDIAAGVDPKQFFQYGGSFANACRVTIKRSIPYFFVFTPQGNMERTLSAQATAIQKANLARIFVRSTLVSLDTEKSKLLNAVIGGLLGGAISLDAVSWKAIAGANIELLKYLDALAIRANVQAGDYVKVLEAPVSLGDLILAMADALPQQGNAVTITALQTLAAQVGPLKLAVGNLINLGTGLGEAALRTSFNVMDLVSGFAQLANSKNAAAVNVNLDLLLAKVGVNLKVIEPPQSGIGDPSRDVIQAKTSQIQLNSSVELDLIGIAGVELGLKIGLGQGVAEITSFQCFANEKSLVVSAQSGVGTIELTGEITALFGLLKIPLSIPLPLISERKSLIFASPKLPRLDDSSEQPNWQTISQSNLVTSLISALTAVLGPLGAVLGAVLSPVTAILDVLITFLLNLLGAGIGNAEIATQLNCGGESELVY